ncbi:MAG: SPOR domain-containing protein [Segatella oulorum]
MIELERHIEILLLTNDCVIIPDFGGFMAHHMSAHYDERDHSFLPPTRSIGFNPQLKINDSLLAQSYVEGYDISYPEAIRRIELETEELKQILNQQGNYILNDLGTLRLNGENNYVFEPCEAGLLTPELYGLGRFELPKLNEVTDIEAEQNAERDLEQPFAQRNSKLIPLFEEEEQDEKSYIIKRSVVRNIAVACIALLICMLIPIPLGNSGIRNIAGNNIDTNLLMHIAPHDMVKKYAASNIQKQPTHRTALPEKAISQNKNESALTKQEDYYGIVLASRVTHKNAIAYTHFLHQKGFTDAQVMKTKRNVKVVFGQYPSEIAARQAMNRLRKYPEFKESWIAHFQ